MADITFVDGLIPKRNDNAPDYAICKLAVKKSEANHEWGGASREMPSA